MNNNYIIKDSDVNPFISFNEKDLKLIPSFDSVSEFRPSLDKVEFSIYNEQGVLEYIDYNYTGYSITSGYNSNTEIASELNIDPGQDLINEKFEQGAYNVVYNFLREKLNTSPDSLLFIQQISSDRTELRLASNIFSNEEIEATTNSFIAELNGSPFFEDFYLNFGNNILSIATNIALDDSNEEQYTIIVKLYDPLPSQISLKDTLWVVLQTAEVISFNIEFTPKVIQPSPPLFIKGPNLDLKIKDEVNNSNIYQSLNTLTSTILTSSKNELKSILNNKGIEIDVNYEDFNDFTYFSSATTRLENFYYKTKQITDYQEEINIILSDITGSTSSSLAVSSSLGVLQNNITNIIENFDGYDNFLYYTSGSDYTWPKSNTSPPYVLETTGSTSLINWYGQKITPNSAPTGVLGSASLYDENNSDRLVNTLPSFVKDDPINGPYFLFVDMIGQHFDVFWTYTKAIEDRYDGDNRLNKGISKDLVADAIRSMGVNLYQNNFSTNDLYSSFVGVNASGSLLPPTGSEIIENYVTASSDITKLDDVNKETYKRIFHNLPFLLKTKGTVTGLRALINCYGVPDTILRISEFGGKDVDNSNDWDYYQNKFNYALFISGANPAPVNNERSNFVKIPWSAVNTKWGSSEFPGGTTPSNLFFRFKPESKPTSSLDTMVASWVNPYLVLEYTGSQSSGSYSGSIASASSNFATMHFITSSTGDKAFSVTAPFYDGNWWSVDLAVSYSADNPGGHLRVANSIYEGHDGFKIGYTASNEGNLTEYSDWNSSNLFIPGIIQARNVGSTTYNTLTGSYQEIRYYNITQSEEVFHDYVMNPYSIEGRHYSSSANNLIFRAPLGSDLITDTGSLISTHPKVTGSLLLITSSFTNNSNYSISSSQLEGYANSNFVPQTEFIYYDQPAVGIKNRVSEKIRSVDNILPSGDVLTPYRTIQQRYPQSESYTRDVNYIEVAYSPQNEINDDINSSMGYFNIGEYIGDPRQISSSNTSYPDLNKLRDDYFQKYYKTYDWKDYIRLIKYFDNSLFKMLKDFVPAKSSITTGVVIKQHLLERNKQKPPIVSYTNNQYSGSIYSSSVIGNIEGGAAGVFNYVNISGSGITSSVSPQLTQSWAYGVSGPSGTFTLTQSSQDEFYNGELSGSDEIATDGVFLKNNPYATPSTDINTYNIKVFRGDGSDNRGQNTDQIVSEADMLVSNEYINYPGLTFNCIRNVPNAPSVYLEKGEMSNILQSYSNLDSLGLNQQAYLLLAQFSGSDSYNGDPYNKYYASSSLEYSDYDTILLPSFQTQNNGGNAFYSFYSRMNYGSHVKVQAFSDPSRYLIFRFSSSSFHDFGLGTTYNENSNGDTYAFNNWVILSSGSVIQSQGEIGGNELVTMYIDNPQVPNNGILIRDFLDTSWSTPEGSLYLFYDTGSNLD